MNDQQIRKSAERARIRAERAKCQEPILVELGNAGIHVSEISELTRMKALPLEIAPILLKYAKNSYVGLDDLLIMAIHHLRPAQPPEPVLKLYEEVREGARWQVGDTISLAKFTHKFDDWLEATLPAKRYGKSREMLCIAAAKHMEKARAIKLLMNVFQEFPGHAAMGLKLIGGEDTLEFLRSQRGLHEGWRDKEISTAIRRIERRLEREKAKQAENIAPIHKQRDKRDARSR